MEKPYHVVDSGDRQGLTNFLMKNGQALLPMMELIEQAQVAVDEVIDVLGRAVGRSAPASRVIASPSR